MTSKLEIGSDTPINLIDNYFKALKSLFLVEYNHLLDTAAGYRNGGHIFLGNLDFTHFD